ncbi:MAG: DUF192 domain-containing protein [Candidatus Pacebacteria bacterium]|nr:DUF192 domain-containing protein [Candidatus Paceibacterota bacterium]
MTKRIIFFFAGCVLIIVFMVFLLDRQNMETAKICFNEHCFLAEIAKTKTQRTKGLMFRENLPSDRAMLFVFEKEGIYSFWMKNCKIPLDIIWLDENYRVVAIKANNQPCPAIGDCPSISSGVSAKYVLEINAGLANQIGLTEGSYFSGLLTRVFGLV